jgi:hypothetical protein
LERGLVQRQRKVERKECVASELQAVFEIGVRYLVAKSEQSSFVSKTISPKKQVCDTVSVVVV